MTTDWRTVELRALQIVVAVACLVPLTAAPEGIIKGAAMIRQLSSSIPPDLDSHFRYLSGIFLVMGIGFATCVPDIAAKGPRFRGLGAMVVVGGLARAWSWHQVGAPSTGHRFGLAMELGVVPLLMLWQWRVAKARGQR